MFSVGDIVEVFAPTAGKKKYHLCVCEIDENGITKFLFINSHDGFEADFRVDCRRIPCLPSSETGNSVFSCSLIVKYTTRQLELFQAKTKGKISRDLAVELADHLEKTNVLTHRDKLTVISAMRHLT